MTRLFRTYVFSISVCGFCLAGVSGCGDERKDVATPVKVTDEMQKQAEASSNYMQEQAKPKKAEGK